MSYADFVATDDYRSKHAGSALAILIFNEDSPGPPLISAATGINSTDDFETVPIEEAGNDGVDEIVQGRHTVSFTVQAFWTPERNDTLPTRQDFIGRKWTVMVVIAPGRPGAGNVVDVWTGCVLSRVGGAHGARGAKTTDLAFSAERRYSGQEWATLSGT
jgi:hypothetical protein